MSENREILRLLAIMAQLRDPQTGCRVDRVQTFDTIAPIHEKKPMKYWMLLPAKIFKRIKVRGLTLSGRFLCQNGARTTII